ncbi:MAG: alpha-2-macroglobulin family protein [Anaerolineae bacterium]
MSRKGRIIFVVALLIIGLLGGLIAGAVYVEGLPERLSQHETIVLGQDRLVPGSSAAMRVIVRDSRDAAPLEDAAVKVLMKPAQGGAAQAQTVFEGRTDTSGTLDVAFKVPDGAKLNQVLIVETRSSLGTDRMEKHVTLIRDYRLLVTTDKPLYQPGQLIHVRVLALGSFDHVPAAEQMIEMSIADGKGNTVFRKSLSTSDFGVASTDFQLASEVNTGPYKITAELGNTVSEKTLTVEHYTLPKFDVELETNRDFYRPGERVEGTLTARYFFGKDVAGGHVIIEGYTFDVTQNVVVSIEGETDDVGQFSFSFELPDYVAGTELDDGLGRFYLEARVTDLAQHTEVGRKSLPVAQQALIIDAIPEGGQIRPGVENILYIITSYPDGSPTASELMVRFPNANSEVTARTGAYGLTEVGFVPSTNHVTVQVEARDTAGAVGVRDFYFESAWTEEAVLLRPDAAIYRVGDTMALTILTSQPSGTVYLDIVREGQTVSTRAVDVLDGHAELGVDLSPDLYGTLELHAYKILRSGHIVRDTRLVVVDQADDLSVDLSPGAETYRPGDEATLEVQVSGTDGDGVRAALGLAIVDESVFGLVEQDPGFAKLYFMLERELLEPKYELHGFSIPDMINEPCPADGPDEVCPAPLIEARASAGKAALASTTSSAPFTLSENSHEQAMERAYARQQGFYEVLALGSFGLWLVVPLALLTLSGVAVVRARVFWQSLGVALGVLVTVVLSLLGLAWLVDRVLWRVQELVMLLVAGTAVVASAIGLIILIVSAVRRKDGLLGVMLGLLPLVVIGASVLGWSASQADVAPETWMIVSGFIAAVVLPLAFVLRGAGFIWERRAATGIASAALGLVLLVALLPVLWVTRSGTMAADVAWQAEEGMAFGEPLMGRGMMPVPEEVAAEKAIEVDLAGEVEEANDGAQQSGEPPRLRQYFPETMLWLPSEITDERGHRTLEFPVADSITTWRVAALASSQDGRLGSATGELRVFQDFFVDLDLPTSLTVGDEIAVPVGVFNYLPESQAVRLEVAQERWFELMDEPVKEIEIASNDITVVYFRIRALDFGSRPFQVTAYGSRMSDAIRKEVRVYPDGKEIRFTTSDKLDPTAPVESALQIPVDAIPGTQKVMVKIYPGIVSQVVEGLDALLRMPFGCFEQTSSTTYPNVLVLDYLKTTDQASPEVQMKAEQYINLGYQRLTTFEVDGEPGGFSLFGERPADPMLTAYGLQEFGDMSRVYDIDPKLIERIAGWLFAHQQSDGSWVGVEGFHETSITSQTGRLPVTAFIVWGLADAGYADDGRTELGTSYLRERAVEAENAYDLAMVANALVAVDIAKGEISPATEAVLNRLAEMAQRDGDSAYWEPGRETYMGGYGTSGQLETTASAALALLRAGRHAELTNAALTYLVRNKDSFGTWETTSATVMALKALIHSVRSGSEDASADVTITLNGGQSRTVQVTPETFDVVQMAVFEDVPVGQDVVVGITMEGTGSLMYQVAGSYYLPWQKLSAYPDVVPMDDLVTIDVSYDRTELVVDDTVEVSVDVSLNGSAGAGGEEPGVAVAEQTIIDLGVPPGFSVETEDLKRLVARFQDLPDDYAYAKIQRFELTGRQIILYVSNLTSGEPLTFSYHLRANFPLRAQTPASTAYDYYNPSTAAEAVPQTLTVVAGE